MKVILYIISYNITYIYILFLFYINSLTYVVNVCGSVNYS